MWWTKKGRKSPKVAAETLEERMVLLEAEFRTLKTEWLNTYEQLYKLAGRLDAARRWGAQPPPTPAIEGAPKAPENGGEPLLQATEPPAAPPTAKMSRSELLRSLS